MSVRSSILLGLAAIALVGGGAALLSAHRRPAVEPRAESQRPSLTLLTSLPLVFGERFGLQAGGSATLTALETRYKVIPIAVADEATLKQAPMLLMAHAAAQPAVALVELDKWVHQGGRLLLLADPALEWESERPLGDPLRPSPMFPDTGLLGHWGVRLDSPDQRGEARRRLGGRVIETLSPGQLSGRCAVSDEGFVADCRLGKGRAIIVADADFLDAGQFEDGHDNLQALLLQLAELERR